MALMHSNSFAFCNELHDEENFNTTKNRYIGTNYLLLENIYEKNLENQKVSILRKLLFKLN